MGYGGPAPFAFARPSPQPRHLHRRAGLVDEDQPFRSEPCLAFEPEPAPREHVRALLLRCMAGLFLCVSPRLAKKCQTVDGHRSIRCRDPTRKPILHIAPQRLIRCQLGWLRPFGGSISMPLRRRCSVVQATASGRRVAPHLAGDRRRCSLQPASNMTYASSLIEGPRVVWNGRRHGPRQRRRWARAWSPEQIAHRLRIDYPGDGPEDQAMRISHEAIYQALYVQGRGALRRELTACLRTGRALRVPRARSRRRGKSFVTPEIMISERSAEAADRAVPGHWEGDLIIGLGRSAIGTLVERATRFTMLLHLPRMEGHGTVPRVKNGPALAGHRPDRPPVTASTTRRRRSFP